MVILPIMTTNNIVKFAIIATITIIARFSMVSGQFAPASAPGPAGVDCTTAVLSAADCLSFIQNGSTLTVPEKPCCPEVKTLVTNYPSCLCQLIGQAADYGVDVSRALQLPTICKVKIPSLSLCPISPTASTPGPSPTSSGPSSTPALASSPVPGGGNGASAGAVRSVFALTTALGVAILPIFF